MPKYRVVFIGRVEYEIEGDDDDKALEEGRESFKKDANGIFDFVNWSVTLIEDEQ